MAEDFFHVYSDELDELTDDELYKLFEGVINEMNRRKAETKKVDVGFWDKDGNYKESIEEISEAELNEGEAADNLG